MGPAVERREIVRKWPEDSPVDYCYFWVALRTYVIGPGLMVLRSFVNCLATPGHTWRTEDGVEATGDGQFWTVVLVLISTLKSYGRWSDK